MADTGVNDRHQDSAQGGAYRRIELITGDVRRRRWTEAEKAAVLAESFHPGACIAEVARRHGVSRSLLCNWRRQVREPRAEAERTFVPIRIAEQAGASDAPVAMGLGEFAGPVTAGSPEGSGTRLTAGTIDIEVGRARVRVSGTVDAAALQQVLAHLGRRA